MKMDQANTVLGAAKRSKRCIMAAKSLSLLKTPKANEILEFLRHSEF
jgi:hypothetical protein